MALGNLLIVSQDPADAFVQQAQELGLAFDVTPSLDGLLELDSGRYGAVIVNSLQYPEPNVLGPEHVAALDRYVRSGGRVYVEFARASNGEHLFGLEIADAPRRALNERLFVRTEHPAVADLPYEAILEEHNSAVLVTSLPEGAVEILRYDAVYGTYEVHRLDPDVPFGSYQVDIDLGEPKEIARYTARLAEQAPYAPELVEVYVSLDGVHYTLHDRLAGAPLVPNYVDRHVTPAIARYVRVRLTKHRRAPGQEYITVGSVLLYDAANRLLAPVATPKLTPKPIRGAGVNVSRQDGTGEFAYWETGPEPLRVPGLVEIPYGEGRILYAASKFSDYFARHYRLSARWEALIRGILLHLLPADEREAVQARWVPLAVHTEPRVWQASGEQATLVVTTDAEAVVHAETGGTEIELLPAGEGVWQGTLTLDDGIHPIRVRAVTAHGEREAMVTLEVSPREVKYRDVLDRSVQWFERSGVLADPMGEGGVYVQRNLAWFDGEPWDGGPRDRLGVSHRLDSNLETAVLMYLYGQLADSPKYVQIARNILRFVLPLQVTDRSRPSYGAWPWLYPNNDSLWTDDNTKIMTYLMYLAWKMDDEELLRAALRTADMFRRVALDDGEAARFSATIRQLDALGEEAFKQLPRDVVAPHYGVLRWYWTYGMTGHDVPKELAETVASLYGKMAGSRAWPLIYWYSDDRTLQREAVMAMYDYWQQFLADPDVRKVGMQRVGFGEFDWAFVNDSSITTSAAEPITDQLYTASYALRDAWWAYAVTRDPFYLDAFHAIGDYLARIQYRSDDQRIDGAWMRGFDFQHWEYYGANYDPNYGPYAAYTGWSNAVIAQAFAMYLMNDQPFPRVEEADPAARAMLEEEWLGLTWGVARTSDRPNVAQGRRYTLTPMPPAGAYGDATRTKLTDGMIEGHYSDGRSVGWHVADRITVTIELDLECEYAVDLIRQRYGATIATYLPNVVTVYARTADGSWQQVFAGYPSQAGSFEMRLDAAIRTDRLRFVLEKVKNSPTEDFLFVGETEVYAEH